MFVCFYSSHILALPPTGLHKFAFVSYRQKDKTLGKKKLEKMSNQIQPLKFIV